MNQPIPERFIGGGVDLSHLVRSGAQRAPQQGRPGVGGAVGGAGIAGAGAGGAGAAGGGAGGAAGGAQGAGNVVDLPAVVFQLDDQSFNNAMQISGIVPVLIALYDQSSEQRAPMLDLLSELVRKAQGKLVLGTVDVDANPQIAQAFAPQLLPTLVMLVGGRPEALFQGQQDPATVQQLFGQIVSLAAQQGMTGTVNAPDLIGGDAADEPPANPAHAAALEAAGAGDYKTAITEYERVLAKNPRDSEAHAALAQVKLLDRLDGKSANEIREAAAANQQGVTEQLAVADLDIAGGHVEDAFLRLLELYAAAAPDDKQAIQARLLELFEVVGVQDPRVSAARRKLASLLY